MREGKGREGKGYKKERKSESEKKKKGLAGSAVYFICVKSRKEGPSDKIDRIRKVM